MRYGSTFALVAALLFGCSCEDEGDTENGDEQSRLVIAGDGELNEDISMTIRLRPQERNLIGSMPVCPIGPGAVKITDVATTGGVEVTGFDLRENPFVHGGEMIGSARGTLEENGLDRATVEELDPTLRR